MARTSRSSPHVLLGPSLTCFSGIYPIVVSWPVGVILANVLGTPCSRLRPIPRPPEHNESGRQGRWMWQSEIKSPPWRATTQQTRSVFSSWMMKPRAVPSCARALKQRALRCWKPETRRVLCSLETELVSLITLDLAVGHDDGLELARQVRALRNIPIVMITGKGAPFDRVVGLEHGADDYISKPFHIREVVLRIRSVLRRYHLEKIIPKPSAEQRHHSSLAFWTPRNARPGRSMVHCSILRRASSCSLKYSSRIRRGSSS